MLPTKCPSCNSPLIVTSLKCENCGTTVTGNYKLSIWLQLTDKEQDFVLSFVKNSGSLKKMASEMKLSYPTVRNLLDDIIKKLNDYEEK